MLDIPQNNVKEKLVVQYIVSKVWGNSCCVYNLYANYHLNLLSLLSDWVGGIQGLWMKAEWMVCLECNEC